MPETITMEYNMENWIEATKGFSFIMYSPEGYGDMPNTIYIQDSTFPVERTPSKASRKREAFFGDNIRDAIKTIKG